MPAIDKLREAGFQLRLLDGQIGITPVESLSDYQKAWITQHRETLLAELRQEAANESSNVDIDLGTDRWQTFIDLVTALGITADEVRAEFTEQDISDLLVEPDDALPLHAQTIADDIHRNRLTAEVERLKAEASTYTVSQKKRSYVHRSSPLQTCGECKNFSRINHPYLGHCQIQAQPETPCGLWATDGRDYCQQYQAVQS